MSEQDPNVGDEPQEQQFTAEQSVFRDAALVVIENRGPDEEDDSESIVEFQVTAAVKCWLLAGSRAAIPLLDILCDRYPDDPHPPYTAGCILARENNAEGLPRLEKAIELDPHHYELYGSEARTLVESLFGFDEGQLYWDRLEKKYAGRR